MVAGAESARDALLTLPAFLRRVTGAEEVALYELEESGDVVRITFTRQPGGPAGADVHARRAWPPAPRSGSGWRSARSPGARWPLLLAALDLESTAGDRDTPAGSFAAFPLLHAGRPQGLIMLRGAARLSPERVRLIEGLARQTMAIFGAHPDNGSPAAVQALAAAIEARDNYTHAHSEQVVALATDVARLLGLSPAEVEAVRHGALLHDVGKLAIPNEILHKPGPLTDAEWLVMAEHPVIGERILRRTPQLGHLAPIVRHEHERWDGGGYPDGLAGTAIPIGSRIILACDAYNAMITTRPYREAMSDRGRDRGAARQGRHAVRPAGGRGAARALGARSARRLRRRDQRRGVGQPRRPVQAAVLREVAQVELRGLDARAPGSRRARGSRATTCRCPCRARARAPSSARSARSGSPS